MKRALVGISCMKFQGDTYIQDIPVMRQSVKFILHPPCQ
jgi:hypothetical protein